MAVLATWGIIVVVLSIMGMSYYAIKNKAMKIRIHCLKNELTHCETRLENLESELVKYKQSEQWGDF